ncbi:MAG: FAD-binding oxidoreductase [Caldilineaceae bacterium]|nr:FAD-binding oxidoreductase [Caldilineaceae bacterium]
MQRSNKISRRTALISLATVGAVAATSREVIRLSADPIGEEESFPALLSESNLTDGPANTVTPATVELPWSQEGGFINDASTLNRTAIHGIVQVRTEAEIQNALQFARAEGRKVALAGVRHSMGGQAFYQDAVVLDMRAFNAIQVDEAQMTMTVQSGATWHDIQKVLHPRYAVKAMQSTDIFTVGGSIAVNAHGMDHQVGSVGRTIRSMRLILTDGTIQTLSPTENAELFWLVIGGYGLFGIILEATLEITENVIYAPGRRVLYYEAFPTVFANELAPNPNLGLMYSHLSTAPQSLLHEMLVYTYERQVVPDAVIEPLGEVSGVKLRRFVLNFSKLGNIPMRIKWYAEKNIEPLMESCSVTRAQAQAQGEACLVSRNQPMHDSVTYLRNNLKQETDILHEYFIPRAQFVPFVDGLRAIVTEYGVNLLNASVRVVHREDNFLTYAPEEAFSVVLYINQRIDDAGNTKMRTVTQALIDLTNRLNGRFFLPYQLHYTPEQLERSYPQISTFFAAKRQYDPALLLTNTWYEKYAPSFVSG